MDRPQGHHGGVLAMTDLRHEVERELSGKPKGRRQLARELLQGYEDLNRA